MKVEVRHRLSENGKGRRRLRLFVEKENLSVDVKNQDDGGHCIPFSIIWFKIWILKEKKKRNARYKVRALRKVR